MPDLLVAGTLHTLDPARPVAAAALIRNGRFERVGTREQCDRAARSDVRFIELKEGCAVPGLIDADGHPLLHARTVGDVRLDGAGLTAVHDASAGPEVLDAYARLAERDELPVRVYAMINGQGPELDEQMRAWQDRRAIGSLCVRSVKLFADGALGSRGAAMFDPYEDDPGNSGLWLLDPGELESRILRVAAAGFQPSVHCIGDRACALVLETFAKVPRALRPRAEHLQVLRPRDVPLLKKSGAIASMQPTHATSDAAWAEDRLGHGTERQRGAYAWRQALDAGAALAFGSDFPVEDIDPRAGLRAAVTRKPAAGPAWMPEQRLRRDEALRAFTAGAAWAEFAEDRRGCIREGFDADLTVFGRDVMAVHVDELCAIPITATVVGGRVVYAGG